MIFVALVIMLGAVLCLIHYIRSQEVGSDCFLSQCQL